VKKESVNIVDNPSEKKSAQILELSAMPEKRVEFLGLPGGGGKKNTKFSRGAKIEKLSSLLFGKWKKRLY